MKKNAGTLLLILGAIIGLLVLCVEYPFVQKAAGGTCVVAALPVLFLLLKSLYRHNQLREFFWNTMPEADKEYINYGSVRRPLGRPGHLDTIFGITREREFQHRRNEKLLRCAEAEAREFIALESRINDLRAAFIILTFVAFILLSRHNIS